MRYFLFFVLILALNVITIFCYHYFTREKIAYVKTAVILEKYEGMVQANKNFAIEFNQAKSTIDTLHARFLMLKNSGSGKDFQYKLAVAENDYTTFEKEADKKLSEKKNQLVMEVVGNVNALIQEYGKKYKYKIILGTTANGSILYANEADDLTEVILQELNQKYNRGKP